jgi:hypothetical protein
MTDQSTEGTQAEPEAQPQAGTPETQAVEGKDEQPEVLTPEKAKELRREHQQLRRERNELAEWKRQREDAEKTESQRTADRLAALEAELNTERTRARSLSVQTVAASTARKLGFKNPDLAVRLISTNDVEFGDDGSPTNIERLLGEAAKEFPDLVSGTTDFGGGPRGSAPGTQQDMNRFIRRAAGRIS